MNKAFGFGVAATMVIGGAASADVLYDNPVGAGGGIAVNQEFPDLPTYSTYLVADFTVPNPGFFLTSVVAPMTLQPGWAGVTTARLHLFAVGGNLPGGADDPTASMIVPVSYDVNTGILSTVGLNLDVAAGDYWIGLTGIGDFGKVGQAFTLEGANKAGLPDAARNPGGSFNFPAGTDWFSIQSFDGWLWHSFALTVEGDPIPPSDLIWFTDQADFEAFNAGEGKVLKGTEDFEEAVLNPGDGIAVDDPLVSGIPNPPVFPVGLTGLPNLQVQSNLSGGNPVNPNPRGADALAAWAAPGGNFVSDVVIANFFVDSLDLIFLTDDKSGVGGNTLHFNNSGTIEMRVYDINNNFLGMMPAPADPAGTNFLGVWSPIPIGRINVFSPQGGAEGLDNIQAWQEGNPCPADLVVNGAVDVKDLLFMLGAWGPNKGHPADLDGSGAVDVKDLLELLGAWGPCPDGNVCEGQVCGEFVECGFGEPFDCFCWTLADGTGICLQNFLCADVEPCIDGDCPDGFVCVFQSCCGDAFCVPIIKCDDGAAAGGDTKGSGPTGSGQFIEASQSAPTRPQNVGTVPRIRR